MDGSAAGIAPAMQPWIQFKCRSGNSLKRKVTVMTDASELPAAGGTLIETEYEVGQDNIVAKPGPFGLDIHDPVLRSLASPLCCL